jgi:hypothetical protein
MPSKIKKFNFNGCQHLRKLVIDNSVEFDGKIDLSDTPITGKNNVLDIDTTEHDDIFGDNTLFKDAPDGITANPEALRKVKLKSGTPIETQTDIIEINLNGSLSGFDKKALELMEDSLYWFDNLKEKGGIDYLTQRKDQLKEYISHNPARSGMSEGIKRLAENALLINEKILENAHYFDEAGNIINPTMPAGTSKKKKWADFHKFLIKEVVDEDGILYKFADKAGDDLKNYLQTHTQYKITNSIKDFLNTNISVKALERVMNTLEATIDKDGSKFYTFADYDEDWLFADYFNNDNRYIGFKPTKQEGTIRLNNKEMTATTERVIEVLFNYWKDNL